MPQQPPQSGYYYPQPYSQGAASHNMAPYPHAAHVQQRADQGPQALSAHPHGFPRYPSDPQNAPPPPTLPPPGSHLLPPPSQATQPPRPLPPPHVRAVDHQPTGAPSLDRYSNDTGPAYDPDPAMKATRPLLLRQLIYLLLALALIAATASLVPQPVAATRRRGGRRGGSVETAKERSDQLCQTNYDNCLGRAAHTVYGQGQRQQPLNRATCDTLRDRCLGHNTIAVSEHAPPAGQRMTHRVASNTRRALGTVDQHHRQMDELRQTIHDRTVAGDPPNGRVQFHG
ncbi:hypothetical protein HK405_003870 [Cladochytrium tenue]|nr:hypothetical protein HK405_003870 [Cladochytrium tenue]